MDREQPNAKVNKEDNRRIPLPTFSRRGYRDLLATFSSAGYSFVGFDDVQSRSKHVIVRHDVDVSLEAAVRLAEIESLMGVRATYFVLVSSTFYNVFSRRGRDLLRCLVNCGHSVGLHFDVDSTPHSTIGGNVLTRCQQAIFRESDLLATIVGSPVDIVSFHKPIPEIINHEHPMGGRPHAYEPRFFSEIGYISDSKGAWRFGSPFDHPAFVKGEAMQLLTHPIWWDRDEPLDPPSALKVFVESYIANFETELAQNCEPYKAVLTERAASKL